MACETCKLLSELLESAGVPTDLAKKAGSKLAPAERKVKRKASAYSIKSSQENGQRMDSNEHKKPPTS